MSRFFKEYAYYFITVPTLRHERLFDSNEKKELLVQRIKKGVLKYDITELYFGINSDHYHLIGYFKNKESIPGLLNFINGGSSYNLNNLDNKRGRMIWDEYYLYLVEDDDALYKIKGYVIGNPYKHGEVKTLDHLKYYKFSSYAEVVDKEGEEMAKGMILSCIDLKLDEIKKGMKLIYY